MKAVGFTEHGGPEVLRFVDVLRPKPGPRDVVVRVKAAGVNPVDSKVRRGLRGRPQAKVPSPVVVGWDGAGVVEAVGEKADRWRVGDEVWFAGDIRRPGSYAESVAVDERVVGRKPATLTFEEAAAIPLCALTSWEAFLEQMGAPEDGGAGRTALVLGGGGGVGCLAIQIAKRVCGLRVAATASRRESSEACVRMGADAILDHTMDLAPQAKGAKFDGFDYVLSCAERLDVPAIAAVLAPLGRICSILPAPLADLSPLFPKRGTLTFEMMFARTSLDAEPQRQGAILDRVADLFDRRTLVAPPTTVLDWSEHREAHVQIDTGHTVGKIVLRVG